MGQMNGTVQKVHKEGYNKRYKEVKPKGVQKYVQRTNNINCTNPGGGGVTEDYMKNNTMEQTHTLTKNGAAREWGTREG